MNEFIKMGVCVHTHAQWNITQPQKDKTTAICDNRLSEINQMDKSKNCMISLICGIESKQKTPNQQTKINSKIQTIDGGLPEGKESRRQAWAKGVKCMVMDGN